MLLAFLISLTPIASIDVWPKTGLSGNQELVIYPGSGMIDKSIRKVVADVSRGAETYKSAYNPASTISGLRKVLQDLLEVAPQFQFGSTSYYETFLASIPQVSLRLQQNKLCIAPALAYTRVQNSEVVQLYPVFPWGEFGLGLPNITYAQNTWLYDTEIQNWRGPGQEIGWRQNQIWLARLGFTANATADTEERLADSTTFRFPAFKGPNFDWA